MKEKKQATENINKIIFLMSSSRLDRYTYIGITMDLLLSKEVFDSNKDIEPFLIDVYGLKFKEYVISCRTNICSKLIRHLVVLNDSDIKESRYRITNYFNQYFEGVKTDAKTSNSNENYGKWLKGIK